MGYIRDFSGEGTFINAIISDCRSNEPDIKKASINAISGIYLGNPNYFESLLTSKILINVENKLYFFSALNSIFSHLQDGAIPEQNLKNILNFLSSLVPNIEENERASIFSAIGQLLVLNKRMIEEKFSEWQSKNHKQYNLLLCMASKSIFKEKIDITKYPIALNFLVNSTKDKNFEVRASAYTALDSALHYNSHIITAFNKDLCTRMALSMIYNSKYVRLVEMGLLKLKIDEAAPVRKICFNILLR